MCLLLNKFIKYLLLLNFVIVIEANIFGNSIVSPETHFSDDLLKRIQISFPFNKTLSISLQNYSHDFDPNVEIVGKNCLFDGQISMNKEVVGTAIISICPNDSQMTGILEMGSDTYTLTPIKGSESEIKIKLFKRSALKTHLLEKIPRLSDQYGYCGNSYYPDLSPQVRTAPTNIPDINFGSGTIRIAVSLDEKIFKDRFNSDMKSAKEFVVIHMAYLQKQLQLSNLKKYISLKVVITRLSVAPFYDTHLWDNYIYLRVFCDWSYKETKKINEVPPHVHILFSGSNLWWVEKNKFSTDIIGLAYTKRLCEDWSSCLTVESVNGYQSLHTLVHEFGHNLGAHHDGDHKFGTQECDGNKYIMSWSISNGKSFWSQCSLTKIRNYLFTHTRKDNGSLKCLQEEATPISPDLSIETKKAINPGHYYSADDQCRLIFGRNYKLDTRSYDDNLCLRMRCKNQFFIYSTAGALEGTQCGQNKMCDRDICKRPVLLDD